MDPIDATETVAAQELRESVRRFSDMLGNLELASVMLDRKARITFCNDYLLHQTGWQREEVLGRNWFQLFVPSQYEEGSDFFERLLDNTPPAWHRENEIVTRTREVRQMRWHNVVLRSIAGDVIGSASVGEDITERKEAQTARERRAAELERFHQLSVGRELQMVELKKQVNELSKLAGREPPYDLTFLDTVRTKSRHGHE